MTRKKKKEETFTQRKKRLEKERIKRKKILDNESFEDKQVRLKKRREKRVKQISLDERNLISERKYQQKLEYNRLYKSQVRAKESAQQRESRLERDRLIHLQSRLSESSEQRESRLERDRSSHLQSRLSESSEQRESRLERDRSSHLQSRLSESSEQRESRIERDRSSHLQSRLTESLEQRDNRLQRNSLSHSQLRLAESFEHRQSRLEQDRLNHLQSRLTEPLEQRNSRLEQDHARYLQVTQSRTNEQHETQLEERRRRNRERLIKIKSDIATFDKTINTFCDKVCEVCTKLCYSNQVSLAQYAESARSYLPAELLRKSRLLLCHRCKTHLTSNKSYAPPKAYWNCLDPGVQPDFLKNLTQPEQRLLSRIIPYLKIIKFNGLYGQFGFRGQAVLFAQDIFEVCEKLPNMLPRSSNTAGMILVTEHLENLNITREFSICRQKIYQTLRWLIANNPLYKDVIIDNEAHIDEQDFIRIVQPIQQQNSQVHVIQETTYKQINDISRILRASWNQGNQEIFGSQFAGTQCCAMALANIVRACIFPPEKWSANTLNMNMIEGDRIHKEIITLTHNNPNAWPVYENGYLEIHNFEVIRNDFMMYDMHFSLEYTDNTDLFGNLQDKKNKDMGIGLNEALTRLFKQHNAGILNVSCECVGVLYYNEKFYFTDSHSCGPKGAKGRTNNGKACIIECDTLAELQRICRRVTGSKNEQYTLNYIDVNCKNDVDIQRKSLDEGNYNLPINQQCSVEQELNQVVVQNTQRNAYINISEISRILRATWNQSNMDVFTSGYAGVQCCAMALANIVRAHIYPPHRWSTNILDENMLQGDNIYKEIRLLTADDLNAHPIYQDGYLEVKNFNVIKEDFIMYDVNFYIEFNDDTDLYGSLLNEVNLNNIGINLIEALIELFQNHQAGILITASKSFGVMNYNGKYYFTDSHSCGPKGAIATTGNGRGCIIECDTINELHRICRRTVGTRNVDYTLNYIEVYTKHDPVLEQMREENEEILDVCSENTEMISEQSQNIPIQTFVMAPNDCLQPDVEEEFEISENVNQIVRKTKDNIVNVEHELRAEEFGWFYLFPRGINGLKEPSRPVRISPLDYFQFRILGKDTRFQRNDYLFYALSMFEYERVKSTISACGKKVEGENGMVDDLHLYLKNLRGSAAYWRTALNELLAMIRCRGPPHYFMTFSCNDLNWLDMKKALLIADGRPHVDANSLSINETQRLIESYPVVVSRHFMIRVNALITFLQNNSHVLGGKIVDFWWRIEFQNRGSPHLHMVVWVEDHPSFDTEEGIQRIDHVCSCELPSEESELYDLVKLCQTHRHTDTCRKNNSICRFSFPRRECVETRIVAHSSDEFIQSGGRICLLKRRKEDKWINNYNPTLLKMWKGNMDIQPCGSNEAIAYYIGKYLSKSEPTELNAGIAQAIRVIQREENDTSRKLFKICMKILHERQVSACECVFRLCHLNLRNSSRKCVFLNTRKPQLRYRVLKFDNFGRATGYCDNIFDRYEKRPIEHNEYNFNNMCLLEFAMRFEPYYKKQDNEESVDEDIYENQQQNNSNRFIKLSDNSRMVIRNNSAVVRVPYFKLSDDPENYYYSMLLQYLPYRRESDLIGEYDNAREAFLAREEQMKEMNEYMQLFRNRDQQLENAINQVHAFEVLNEDPYLQDDQNEDEVIDNPMNDDQFQQAQRAMNVGQTEIFRLVTRSIRDQIMNNSTDRLRLFITGNAGTGKTFLLQLLKNQINRCFSKNSVKVCALTGVAAKLIGGSTLHSALKLPVQKDGKIVQMPLLTGMYLRQMRNQWTHIETLFIDEISMVPYEMLCMIDSRLRQLKNIDELFGGINVLFFGDLMQLPPVRGNQAFHQPFHLRPATHLWQLFTLVELTENMRQQGDMTFINILNALRIGELKAEHISVLMKKVSKNEEGEFSIEKALRIYPTNEQVFNHNQRVLSHFEKKGVQMIKLKAQDQLVDATRNNDNVNVDDIVPDDINKTGGMPKELIIFVGAKVMLRSNIDVSKGLVNGAIGFITEIRWPHFRRQQMYETDLPSVLIDFGPEGTHLIQPRSVQFPAKFSYGTVERRMLPMVLSWASTVHKMQGCTVNYAVIYLGSKLFAEGQAYVALSRVKSLEGLQIEELDSSKITGKKPCNNNALSEMERMRSHRPS